MHYNINDHVWMEATSGNHSEENPKQTLASMEPAMDVAYGDSSLVKSQQHRNHLII